MGSRHETAVELGVRKGHREIVQLLMDSCDCFPFHLLFLALSREPIVDEVVGLLCSKRIVADSQITTLEYRNLLNKLMQCKQKAYVIMLLEKGTHVLLNHFESLEEFPQTWRSRWSRMMGFCMRQFLQ